MTHARPEVTELIALIDHLERLLDRSDLTEIELEVGGRTLILRSPDAVAPVASAAVDAPMPDEMRPLTTEQASAPASSGHAITAPLTGVFYRSPSPGADPYVGEGDQVSTGQVIGLIEAMKLFNEIKSDITGTVQRLVAGDGDLVKARETLIEVEPS